MSTRSVGLAVSAALLVIGLAGCGGSDSGQVATARTPGSSTSSVGDTPASGSASSTGASVLATYVDQMQKYVDCLRQHGFAKIPDPNQYGQILVDGSMVPDQGAFHTAQVACEKLAVPMPAEVGALVDEADGSSITPAQKKAYRAYATCMQAHGAPDFPDPEPNGDAGDREWDQTSAGAQQATKACASIIGDPSGSGPGVG